MAKTKVKSKPIGGPFLAAAVFCDNIVEDTDHSISAIMIIDGVVLYVSEDAPPDFPSKEKQMLIMQKVLLTFRSGDSPGKHQLSIVLHQPNGKRVKVMDKEIELTPPPHGGVNLKTGIQLSVHSSGLFLFDVILDGKRLTRMPFNVAIQRKPRAEMEASALSAAMGMANPPSPAKPTKKSSKSA